ncbi:uncharacterized protein LOC123295139 [Chrysoperla carnea]|uniref:uncharacterized protein LOC123295139 n=1 Tax=Chrysoperla carnea TaxID=189513 RepID=UPI001D084807|nr:uncharacterized protein LOC123295139 [Chrysoperla carnea]
MEVSCFKFIKIYVILSIYFIYCVYGDNTTNNNKDSCEESQCLKCGPAGCMKCPQLIVFATRQCVEKCPFGYSTQWSRLVDYMGQVCFNTGHIWGISGETFAILTGIVLGAILCVFIIIGGLIYMRYRKRTIIQSTLSAAEKFNEDTQERRDFLKQLELLRPHAYTFLDMLNDTRRQIRELYNRNDHAGVAAYKPVVRDLAKLLVLLNRTPDQIYDVPNDWERLSMWAEKLLKRYKRMSDSSSTTQQQVAQLINFLQTPNNNLNQQHHQRHSSSTEPNSQFTTLSTFKPDQSIVGSQLSLKDAVVQNYNSRYVDNNQMLETPLNPSWEFPNYSLVTMGTLNWSRSKDYLNNGNWFDDDFLQLGYRPQDEITTEL